MPKVPEDLEPYRRAWSKLLDRLAGVGHLEDDAVRAAMTDLPRWEFLDAKLTQAHLGEAVDDAPVTLPEGQTISAPHMVAILLSAAEPEPGDRCLEVGAGSGWLAAILARLVGEEGYVVAMEVVPELAQLARENLAEHGLEDRVEIVLGDGGLGHPEAGPYDVIILSCAAPSVPDPLTQQLTLGGRLVIPVGQRHHQTLRRFTRTEQGLEEESLGGCRFVPLVGEHGFSPSDGT